MSRTSDLMIDIQNDIELSELTFSQIADKYLVPFSWVDEAAKELAEQYAEADPGEMDGDHASALASAGWGTDEDYGYFGA
jgi:hypothetical protein